MAETKVDKSNSLETLEQQVDALLSDVQASLHDVESQMAAEAPRPPAKKAEPVAAETRPAVTEETVQAAAKPNTPEAVDSLDTEMAAELSRTLDEAEKAIPAEPVAEIVAEPTVEPVAPAAPIAVTPVIEEPVAADNPDASDAREVAEAAAALAAEVAKMIETNQPPEAMDSTGEPDQTSLDAAVSEMVADATAAVTPEAAKPEKEEPPAEKTAAASSVEDLDSQLASLTEQLLSEPTPEVAAHVPAAPHIPTPLPVAAMAAPATAASAVAAHDGTGKGGGGNPVTLLKSAPARLNVLAPLIVTILKPLSMPLNKQPRIVRDTLGWVAMITLFWALTIWAYLIFFHKPVESEAPEHATRISTGEPAHGEGSHGKQSGKNSAKSGEEDTARNLPAIRNVKQADAHKPSPAEDEKPAAAHGEH